VVTFDPALASSLQRITEAKARELVGGLTGERPITIGGHYYWLTQRGPDTVEAAEYTRERLDRQGLSRGPEDGNVIGVREGEVRPSEVILVLAHLNADGGWPGADDNASGSAAVMLTAEALGRHQFERTVRFILFPEEIVDSQAYAQRMAASGENLVAVINLDMVGNDAGQRRAIIYVGNPSDPTYGDEMTIGQTFVAVAQAYSLDFTPLISETCG
jgi:hypothetical protein